MTQSGQMAHVRDHNSTQVIMSDLCAVYFLLRLLVYTHLS